MRVLVGRGLKAGGDVGSSVKTTGWPVVLVLGGAGYQSLLSVASVGNMAADGVG